ncbi:MAG: M20/M25/M40 family metallo-hydrolase [Candidatus Symbiothrix sp.]|nr:M20/M25/M40 family metallo-hydrolase [Candidatus Symbiothrix sp.]
MVVGAHYDHLGVDELLVGDQIYNGADDNASGVVAVLQLAKAFAVSGEKPLRSIIFAFFDGEEINYLGSEYFIANFQQPQAIKSYINIDMIGREGLLPEMYPKFKIPEATIENTATGKQFHLAYTEELSTKGEQASQDITKHHLDIIVKPSVIAHKSRGTDALSFSLRTIPVAWFFTGLHPDYHTPIDEVSTLDLDKVTDITQSAYLFLRSLAN